MEREATPSSKIGQREPVTHLVDDAIGHYLKEVAQQELLRGFRDSMNFSYLRGFFDAEGSIRKSRPHISLGNSDIELMDKIINTLTASSFKFKTRLKTTTKGTPYREVDIMGFAQIYKWFSEIGSCLDHKIAAWDANALQGGSMRMAKNYLSSSVCSLLSSSMCSPL